MRSCPATSIRARVWCMGFCRTGSRRAPRQGRPGALPGRLAPPPPRCRRSCPAAGALASVWCMGFCRSGSYRAAWPGGPCASPGRPPSPPPRCMRSCPATSIRVRVWCMGFCRVGSHRAARPGGPRASSGHLSSPPPRCMRSLPARVRPGAPIAHRAGRRGVQGRHAGEGIRLSGGHLSAAFSAQGVSPVARPAALAGYAVLPAQAAECLRMATTSAGTGAAAGRGWPVSGRGPTTMQSLGRTAASRGCRTSARHDGVGTRRGWDAAGLGRGGAGTGPGWGRDVARTGSGIQATPHP
jgi:hypothetical protein